MPPAANYNFGAGAGFSREYRQALLRFYYSTEGLRIANPQRGTTVIAISRTQSGRTIANKLVIK